MTWLPIETAPRDGRMLRLRRVVGGRVVHEAAGRFTRLTRILPALNGFSRHWLTPDRLSLWGGPTHWAEQP